jgi:hypothetical protein
MSVHMAERLERENVRALSASWDLGRLIASLFKRWLTEGQRLEHAEDAVCTEPLDVTRINAEAA